MLLFSNFKLGFPISRFLAKFNFFLSRFTNERDTASQITKRNLKIFFSNLPAIILHYPQSSHHVSFHFSRISTRSLNKVIHHPVRYPSTEADSGVGGVGFKQFHLIFMRRIPSPTETECVWGFRTPDIIISQNPPFIVLPTNNGNFASGPLNISCNILLFKIIGGKEGGGV